TLRLDLTHYESWLRSAALWFYEPLLRHYGVERLFTDHVLWSRKDDKSDGDRVPLLTCAIVRSRPEAVVLRVAPQDEPVTTPAFVALELAYASVGHGYNPLAWRARVAATLDGLG